MSVAAQNCEIYALYDKYDDVKFIKLSKLRCGACSTYGGKERCIQDFGGET
jgi:hypothetical protein